MDTRKKILVVDDDRPLLEAMSFMLSNEGYEVVTNRGNTVIREILRTKPDIVLMDVLLSGRDGRDICKKIKEQENTKLIPIILVSAHPAAKKTYRKFLADAFLAKPFDNDQLLALIQKYINN
jgi:DNA-binding response OmpR family regulator